MNGKIWGKIIGSLLGFAMGGPVGAIFGFIIGHIHDVRGEYSGRNSWSQMAYSYDQYSGDLQQSAFSLGVIVLGAKMAKADGRVTREEINAFKSVFNVTPQNEPRVAQIFDQALRSASGYEPYAIQLAKMFRGKTAVLEEILGGLFIIGAADTGGLTPAELHFLKQISGIFGFNTETFYRVAVRAGIKLPPNEQPRSMHDENYEILGVRPEIKDEDLKAVYRSLIREHHPDMLMAKGVAPEFVAIATEKMKRINSAYDAICKQRGLN